MVERIGNTVLMGKCEMILVFLLGGSGGSGLERDGRGW